MVEHQLVFNVYYGHLISSIKDYLLPHFRHTRSHKLAFQTISATINSYRFSLVVNGIFCGINFLIPFLTWVTLHWLLNWHYVNGCSCNIVLVVFCVYVVIAYFYVVFN